MSPHSVDSGPLSDVFKAKVTTLIRDQLKPIVAELAAQQETLVSHLALLKHNYNVNDYQMTRLENIRNLEQSINFKVTGALGFCPWQHSSMGTNLREPVPADPLKIPQFMPHDHATRAERTATSAALIKEAGVSAQRLGVPLTLQDFPRELANHKGEDSMHLSVPLFGLDAPRWRSAEGLSDHDEPGTASYDGVRARPLGNRGLQQWDSCAKKKKMKRKPLFKLVEEGTDPYGIGVPAPSSSSIRRAGSSLLEALDVPVREPRGLSSSSSSFDSSASPPETTDLHTPPAGTAAAAAAGRVPSSAPAGTGLSRSSTMATIGSTTTTQTLTEPPSPVPPPLCRSGAMAQIGPASPGDVDPPTETTLESALDAARATIHRAAAERKEKADKARKSTAIGSPSPSPPPASRTSTTAKLAKAKKPIIKSTSKSKAKAKTTKAKAKTTAGPRRRKRAGAASASAAASTSASSATATSLVTSNSDSTAPSQSGTPSAPRRTLKRARRTADDNDDNDEQHQGRQGEEAVMKEEQRVDGEPPRKRLKRATAPSSSSSSSPTVGRGSTVVIEADEGGDRVEHTSSRSQGSLRRSTRVTRASAGAATAEAVVPARRGQATKGKKAKRQ